MKKKGLCPPSIHALEVHEDNKKVRKAAKEAYESIHGKVWLDRFLKRFEEKLK